MHSPNRSQYVPSPGYNSVFQQNPSQQEQEDINNQAAMIRTSLPTSPSVPKLERMSDLPNQREGQPNPIRTSLVDRFPTTPIRQRLTTASLSAVAGTDVKTVVLKKKKTNTKKHPSCYEVTKFIGMTVNCAVVVFLMWMMWYTISGRPAIKKDEETDLYFTCETKMNDLKSRPEFVVAWHSYAALKDKELDASHTDYLKNTNFSCDAVFRISVQAGETCRVEKDKVTGSFIQRRDALKVPFEEVVERIPRNLNRDEGVIYSQVYAELSAGLKEDLERCKFDAANEVRKRDPDYILGNILETIKEKSSNLHWYQALVLLVIVTALALVSIAGPLEIILDMVYVSCGVATAILNLCGCCKGKAQ